MERTYVGIIKAGELVKVTGSPEALRPMVDSAIMDEMERLRRENAILRGQIGMMRARDAAHWQELSMTNHKRPRRLPEWVKGLEARVLTVWACLTLGASTVYGDGQ